MAKGLLNMKMARKDNAYGTEIKELAWMIPFP